MSSQRLRSLLLPCRAGLTSSMLRHACDSKMRLRDRTSRRAPRASRGGWELLIIIVVVLVLCVSLSQLSKDLGKVPSDPNEPQRVLPHGHTVFNRFQRLAVDTYHHSAPATPPLQLLLSTHNRLFHYSPDSGEERTLHENEVCAPSPRLSGSASCELSVTTARAAHAQLMLVRSVQAWVVTECIQHSWD